MNGLISTYHFVPWSTYDLKDHLPSGWAAERFKIVEGGAGRVGIKGTWANQCLGRQSMVKRISNRGEQTALGWWIIGWMSMVYPDGYATQKLSVIFEVR